MEQGQQLVVGAFFGLLGDDLPAQCVDLLAQFGVLAFGVKRSPIQLNRSRTGFSALLAPSWIGETTVRKPRCTECRRPLRSLAEVGGQE